MVATAAALTSHCGTAPAMPTAALFR